MSVPWNKSMSRFAVAAFASALAFASPVVNAGPAANRVLAIDSHLDGAATVIRIRGTGAPTFTVYKLARPARVVVDVARSRLDRRLLDAGHSLATWNVNTWAVGQVTAHEIDGDSGRAVRVIVALARPGSYKVEASGSDVIVRVTARERKPAPPGDAAAKKAIAAAQAQAAAARQRVASVTRSARRQARRAAQQLAAARAQAAAAEQALAQARSGADAARRAAAAAEQQAAQVKHQAAARQAAAVAAVAKAKRMLARADARMARAKKMEKAAAAATARADARDKAARAAEQQADALRAEAHRAAQEAARDRQQAQAAADKRSHAAGELAARAEAAAKRAEARRHAAERAARVAETRRAAAETAAKAAEARRAAAAQATAAVEADRHAAELQRAEAVAARRVAVKRRQEAEAAEREAEARRAAAEASATAAQKRAAELQRAAAQARAQAADAHTLEMRERAAYAAAVTARRVAEKQAAHARAVTRREQAALRGIEHAKKRAADRQRAARAAKIRLAASRQAVAAAEAEADARRAEADAAKKRAAAYERKSSKSEKRLATLRAQAKRLEAARRQADATLAARRRDAAARRAELATLSARRKKAAAQLAGLEKAAAAARAQRKREEAKLAELSSRRVAAERELAQAKKARADAAAVRKAAAAELARAKAARSAAETRRKAAERELAQAKTARSAAEARRQAAERELAQAKTARSAAEARRQAAEQEFAQAKKARADAAEARKAAATELSRARAAKPPAGRDSDPPSARHRQGILVQAMAEAVKRAARAAAREAASPPAPAFHPGRAAAPAPALAATRPAARSRRRARRSRRALAKVRSVRFSDRGGVSRVVISLSAPARAQVIARRAHQAVLEITGARISARLQRTLDTSRFGGAVRAVSSFRDPRHPGAVRVAVELAHAGKGTLRRRRGGYVWAFPNARRTAQASPVPRPSRRHPTLMLPRTTDYPAPIVGDYGRAAGPMTSSRIDPIRHCKYKNRTIDLDFVNADIHNLMRLLADVGDVNIVIPDDIKGSVTVTLRKVPWTRAMEVILASKGLWYRCEGSIIRIDTRKKLDAEAQAEQERLKALAQSEAPEAQVFTLNYSKAKKVAPQIKPLLSPKGRIEVDTRTNSLIINDLAANRRRIIQLLTRLDTQTPQIQIEARVVEAQSNFTREIGIQWGGNFVASQATGNSTGLVFPNSVAVGGGADDNTTASGGVAATPPNFAVNLPAAVGSGAGGALGLSLGSVGGNFNLNLRLSALEDQGTVRIVSAPKITVVNNVKATISDGVSIPISVVSANGVQTRFVNADLSLQVTPHVSQRDCSISMDIKVTKNQPDFAQTGARGDPTILRKEATTTILVRDGETSVIGGIYTRNTSVAYEKVPFFGDIPVLGWLFKHRLDQDNRTEVLIFITPKITNRAFLRCEE